MTWKVTAAASGVGVIGMWLASYAPPARVPAAGRAAATAGAPNVEEVAADVQREAQRLHDGLKRDGAFRDPARNPFRFGSRPPPAVAARATRAAAAPVAVEPQPPIIPFTLAGIAESAEGDAVTRTAVISAPDDVWMVRVGDEVGEYRVAAIAADAVDLVRRDDGTAIRLTLRP